jgi:hypothetical protein
MRPHWGFDKQDAQCQTHKQAGGQRELGEGTPALCPCLYDSMKPCSNVMGHPPVSLSTNSDHSTVPTAAQPTTAASICMASSGRPPPTPTDPSGASESSAGAALKPPDAVRAPAPPLPLLLTDTACVETLRLCEPVGTWVTGGGLGPAPAAADVDRALLAAAKAGVPPIGVIGGGARGLLLAAAAAADVSAVTCVQWGGRGHG